MRSVRIAAHTLTMVRNATAKRRLREGRRPFMALACVNGARECDGCMMCQKEPEPCPCCGSECYEIRYIQGGEWIGCDKCIAADWL